MWTTKANTSEWLKWKHSCQDIDSNNYIAHLQQHTNRAVGRQIKKQIVIFNQLIAGGFDNHPW